MFEEFQGRRNLQTSITGCSEISLSSKLPDMSGISVFPLTSLLNSSTWQKPHWTSTYSVFVSVLLTFKGCRTYWQYTCKTQPSLPVLYRSLQIAICTLVPEVFAKQREKSHWCQTLESHFHADAAVRI